MWDLGSVRDEIRMSAMFATALAIVVFVVVLMLAYHFVLSHANKNTNMTSPFVLVRDPNELAKQPGIVDYFSGFGACDVAARTPLGCADLDGYLDHVVVDVDPSIEARLRSATAEAAGKLRRWTERASSEIARFVRSMASPLVPWRVILLHDRAEGGWPHTHGDIICLPLHVAKDHDHDKLVSVLIHERVHVLQRARAVECRAFYESAWNLAAIPTASFGREILDRRRSNPDLDGFVYGPAGSGRASLSLFDSVESAARGGLGAATVRSLSLNDTTDERIVVDERDKHDEHPSERMAYEVQKELASRFT